MTNYMVTKYVIKGNETESYDLGLLPKEDVKRILKGYKYDSLMEMWFSKAGNIGYDIREVE